MFARDVEMFIEHCENKGLATKTIGSYEQTLRLLMLWLDEQGITQTEKITHVVIQDYVKQIKERGKYTVTSNPNSGNYQERRIDFGKKVSDVTINNYLRNMSVFFNWCVEEGLILRSPVKRRDYIKVERRPLEFVSDEDFRKLLRNMNTASFSEYRDYIIIQLLLDTGMRINECLMIQVTDVNLPKRYIYLPAENTKGKKGRHVFFSDKMATQLQRWIKYKDRYRDSDFLFCTNKGKFLEVSNFEKNVRKYAQRIGLKDIHPHVFRNNFAKRFLMSGGDIYTLSRLLGHIAAFDYYLKCGDTSFDRHHAVIVPDTQLYTHNMNATNTTEGGYVNSLMRLEGLTQAKEKAVAVFGADHVLTHRVYLTNAVTNGKPSGGAWFDSDVELMNENMVYGSHIFAPGCDGSTIPTNYTVEKSQLPLFQLAPHLISNRQWFWLRDVVSSAYFARVFNGGNAYYYNASYEGGVRPDFPIG